MRVQPPIFLKDIERVADPSHKNLLMLRVHIRIEAGGNPLGLRETFTALGPIDRLMGGLPQQIVALEAQDLGFEVASLAQSAHINDDAVSDLRKLIFRREASQPPGSTIPA